MRPTSFTSQCINWGQKLDGANARDYARRSEEPREEKNMMRTLIAAACLAVALPAAAASSAQGVDAAWQKAASSNDLEGLVKLYAPDAVAWFPDMAEARGTDAIRAAYKALLDANKITAAKLSDAVYHAHGGRAVGWGKFSIVLQPKAGGSPVTMAGRYSAVFEKRGKDWVFVVDHASNEPPKPDVKEAPKAAPKK